MPKRPRDVNQLAKMIVDLSTGECDVLQFLPDAQKTLRYTPAMTANVTKTLWSLDDLLNAVEPFMPQPPSERGSYKKKTKGSN